MEGFNRAPRYITLADVGDAWGYYLHFRDVSNQEAPTVFAEVHAAFADLSQRYSHQLFGAATSHNFNNGVASAVVYGEGEEASLGHPFYKALRQRVMPTLYYTAQHKVRPHGNKACDVAFRILGSEPMDGIESKLVTAAHSLDFRVRVDGLDHVVAITGGTRGYDNLMAAFNANSVYLEPLTEGEKAHLS